MRKSTLGTLQRPGVLKPRNSDSTPSNRRSAGLSARKSFLSKTAQGENAARGGGRTRRGSGDGPNRLSATALRFTPTRSNPYSSSSLAVPSSASRASSDTRNSSMGTVSRKEMRPITDGSFKSRCIDKILNFLISNQYCFQVQRRTLLTPSAKDFVNIFQFIYRHLDSTYVLPNKFEEEIPRLLKLIHYPVQLPKSSFITVGSPHTWPSVLAMLDWFVDVINLDFDADANAFPRDFDSDMQANKTRFSMDIKLYQSETEEERQEYSEEYRHILEQVFRVRPQDMIKCQEEQEQLEDEEASLNGYQERVVELKQLHTQCANDHEKLFAYCHELEVFCSNKEAETVKQDQILAEERKKIQKFNDEVASLMQIKAEQAFSAADLARFKNHANHVATVSQQLQQQSKDLESRAWSKEMETGKGMKCLSDDICSYNALVSQLENSSDLEISSVISSENTTHCQNELLSQLRMKKKLFKHEAFQAQSVQRTKEDEAYMVKEMQQEKTVEGTKLESKQRRLEDDKLHTKDEIETEQKEMLQESERLLEQIKETRKANKNSLYQKQCAIDQSNDELGMTKTFARETAQKGAEFLVKMSHAALDHLEFNSRECLKFKISVNKVCEDMQDVIKDDKDEKQE